MRIFLSFIFCFQNINAGLRDALGRHAVSALSDYAQHRVSKVDPFWFILQGLEQLNLKAKGSPFKESKKINQERLEELERRESKISRPLNALRSMFEDQMRILQPTF